MGGEDVTRQVAIILTTDSSGTVTGIQLANGEFEKLDKKTKETTDHLDKSSKGFHLLGIAAGKAGESIGVPFQASHMLGTKVAEMARSTFPAWGTALGGVGIAALAATTIISKLVESHKQHSEEIKVEIENLSKLTDELYKDTYATADLSKAQMALAESARITLTHKLAEQYQEQYEKLQKLNKEAETGGGAWTKYWTAITKNAGSKDYYRAMDELKVHTQDAARDAAKALDVLYEKIVKLSSPPEKKSFDALQYQIQYEKEYQSVLKARGATVQEQHDVEMTLFDLETQNIEYKLKREGVESVKIKEIINLRNEEKAALESSFAAKNTDNDWIARRIKLQEEEQKVAASQQKINQQTVEHLDYEGQLAARQSQNEADIAEQAVAMAKARGDSMEAIHQAEIIAFDSVTDAKLKGAKTLDDANQIYSEREKQRIILQMNQDKEASVLRIQVAHTALDALVNGYRLAGEHSLSAFHKYKTLAKVQTAINTAEGAVAAYKAMAGIPYIGPALGIAAAAALVFYGKEQMSAIDAQQPGGAPGSTAGVPTYSANPATGMPSSVPAHITIVINGKEADIGETMTQGVKWIYEHNNSVGGGYELQVVRSA